MTDGDDSENVIVSRGVTSPWPRTSFELAVHSHKQAIELVRSSFTDPDDDWQNMCIMDTVEGLRHCVELNWRNQKEQALYVQAVVPHLVEEMQAWCVAFVIGMWQVAIDPPFAHGDLDDEEVAERLQDVQADRLAHPERWPRPSEHPDREEMLSLEVVSAEQWFYEKAPILRHPDSPPTLGNWYRPRATTSLFRESCREKLSV